MTLAKEKKGQEKKTKKVLQTKGQQVRNSKGKGEQVPLGKLEFEIAEA